MALGGNLWRSGAEPTINSLSNAITALQEALAETICECSSSTSLPPLKSWTLFSPGPSLPLPQRQPMRGRLSMRKRRVSMPTPQL